MSISHFERLVLRVCGYGVCGILSVIVGAGGALRVATSSTLEAALVGVGLVLGAVLLLAALADHCLSVLQDGDAVLGIPEGGDRR